MRTGGPLKPTLRGQGQDALPSKQLGSNLPNCKVARNVSLRGY